MSTKGTVTANLKVINPNTLQMEWMTQPGTSAGGGTGDASAANQTTEITKLTSIDTKLSGPIPVSDNGGSLTVDGTVAVSGTVPVSGPLTDTQIRASALPVSVGNFPASQAVTGTFFQATQPVSASSLPLPSGASTEATLSAMSAKLPASVGQKTMAASLPVTLASDQGAIATMKAPTGGTNVLKTGTITTTATTADQVVLTYTVTAGKTLYLQYVIMYGRLTVPAATATILGAISLETPSGTKVLTFDDMNPTTSELEFNPMPFPEPVPIAAGTVVRIVVTPAAATSMLWRGNFGAYEK